MLKDSVGQPISIGNICVHVYRRSSSLYFEWLRVEEMKEGMVRGTKRLFNWVTKQNEYKRSHFIHASNVVVTQLQSFPD